MKSPASGSVKPDISKDISAKGALSSALILLTKFWHYLSANLHQFISPISHQTRHTLVSPQNRKVQKVISLPGSRSIVPRQTNNMSDQLPKHDALFIWRISFSYHLRVTGKGDRPNQSVKSLTPDPSTPHLQLVAL